ncbi:glycosyltransferase family 2 protein [Neolewinella antarctica]|uniref:Glycosyltransferase involved in cell wall biosynthesis n=1 Tax=Neolewinella antarctica TaxID=442734 RepID=A0ABX0X832_9BACT|nr:glycosyltransferase family A protein [Neolewinella antarctica]NJC25396.1 glycosyltransferase involved in cell wall biosynthesis [Neolewinella antarctica]
MQVSVIIAAHNVATTLWRAVNSCLLQGEAIGEIILVDNNSTDETGIIIDQLVTNHPTIITKVVETRQGSSAARNAGLRHRKFEWIQFLDADDELLGGKIDRQRKLINPETDWIMGVSVVKAPGGATTTLALGNDPWKEVVFQGGLGDMNANLFRFEKLREVGFFDVSLVNGIDMDLYVRLLCAGAVWTHDHVVGAVYYEHDGPRLSRRQPEILRAQEVLRKVAVADYLRVNRPAYYQQNEAFFRAAILRGIRQVYTYDRGRGQALWAEIFPSGIALDRLDRSLLPRYHTLYGVLGFHRTECLRLMAKKWLGGS